MNESYLLELITFLKREYLTQNEINIFIIYFKLKLSHKMNIDGKKIRFLFPSY